MNRTRWYFLLLLLIAVVLATAATLLLDLYGSPQLALRLIIPAVILSIYTSAACVSYVFSVALPKSALPTKKLLDIPADSKTVVVIPCLLSSREIVDRLVDNLRDHYRANSLSNVSYHLLSDYVDASTRDTESDADLLAYAKDKIDSLNSRISNVFGLLNRPRTWSSTEGVWMGRERKRGKLENLNQLLLGHGTDSFDVLHCDPNHLRNVEYVITVDADTLLPRDAVISLVGIMSHPDNCEFDLIQPGVRAFPGEPVNLYQWIMFPLFPPLSVFQNLFGKTKYVGKGIYSVRRFHSKLTGQFPDGWVLSHDVLESCFLSVGSSEGTVLYEKNPETIAETMSRLHRWYRGDWQSLPWVLPRRLRRRISEFKSIDSKRLALAETWRLAELMFGSLQAPAKLFFLLAAGTEHFLLALFFVLAFDFVSSGMVVLAQLARGNKTVADSTLKRIAMRQMFSLFSLPSFAKLALDAIIRALSRMFVSKQLRLEWSAFAEWKALSNGAATTSKELYPNYVVGGLMFAIGVIGLSYVMIAFSVALILFPLTIPTVEKVKPPAVVRTPSSDANDAPPTR